MKKGSFLFASILFISFSAVVLAQNNSDDEKRKKEEAFSRENSTYESKETVDFSRMSKDEQNKFIAEIKNAYFSDYDFNSLEANASKDFNRDLRKAFSNIFVVHAHKLPEGSKPLLEKSNSGSGPEHMDIPKPGQSADQYREIMLNMISKYEIKKTSYSVKN